MPRVGPAVNVDISYFDMRVCFSVFGVICFFFIFHVVIVAFLLCFVLDFFTAGILVGFQAAR